MEFYIVSPNGHGLSCSYWKWSEVRSIHCDPRSCHRNWFRRQTAMTETPECKILQDTARYEIESQQQESRLVYRSRQENHLPHRIYYIGILCDTAQQIDLCLPRYHCHLTFCLLP
ncbi:Uncharacterized protein HZ326_5839 [Fusarium oxysporum f. sp. albedinis]|nr:Uncharacterized protein HZ326_5839 [Fusarium oxysporum f. sp. albedinis]